jgi:hypothetical protein
MSENHSTGGKGKRISQLVRIYNVDTHGDYPVEEFYIDPDIVAAMVKDDTNVYLITYDGINDNDFNAIKLTFSSERRTRIAINDILRYRPIKPTPNDFLFSSTALDKANIPDDELPSE